MVFRKIGFAPIANKPAAVSSVLFAALRRALAESGNAALAEEAASVSLVGNDIVLKSKGKMAAAEFSLRSDSILEAFEASLSGIFPPGRTYRLRIK